MADKFDQWAILEVMGHQKFAGHVTEQAVGGASFVRIDIPEGAGRPAFTKLFGGGSIYCITPVTEEVARALAARIRSEPVQPWELPESYKQPARVLACSPDGPPTEEELDADLEDLRDEDDG